MPRVADDDLQADEAAGLVPVGEWPSLAEAYEHSLVVLAMLASQWAARRTPALTAA